METRIDTDVVPGPAAPRASEAAESLSTLSAILDVVRPPGRALRVLEVASGGVSLATLASPDEVVSLDGSASGDRAPRGPKDAYDCAVAIDALHRLEPEEQRPLLMQLRRAARAAVLLEAPRPSGVENPFEEASSSSASSVTRSLSLATSTAGAVRPARGGTRWRARRRFEPQRPGAGRAARVDVVTDRLALGARLDPRS